MAYTTEVLVEAELGETFDGSSTPKSDDITTWIAQAEIQIDLITQTTFTTRTVTDEYHDYDGTGWIKYNNSPLISVTSLEYNDKGLGEAVNWVSLTEGYADDFLSYLNNSRVRIHSKTFQIPQGNKNIKSTYIWGRASVPKNIEWLATLIVAERVLGTKMKNLRFISAVDITIGQLSVKHTFASVRSQRQIVEDEIKILYGASGKLRVYLDNWNE